MKYRGRAKCTEEECRSSAQTRQSRFRARARAERERRTVESTSASVAFSTALASPMDRPAPSNA